MANIVPSAPMSVGVYASPRPGVKTRVSDKVFVTRLQRYSFPSSLPARMDLEDGSTTAELMHHSLTAGGAPSGLGPATDITSAMTVTPVMGSTAVPFGSRTASLF